MLQPNTEYINMKIDPATTKQGINMKIDPATKESELGYHVDLGLPDGKKITVLVPNGGDSHLSVVDGKTYGLNMITDGHYAHS